MELHPKTIAALAAMFVVASLSCIAKQSRSADSSSSPSETTTTAVRSEPPTPVTISAAEEYSTAPVRFPYRTYAQTAIVEPAAYSEPTFLPAPSQDDELIETRQIVQPQFQPAGEVAAYRADSNLYFSAPGNFEAGMVADESTPPMVLDYGVLPALAMSGEIDMYTNNVNDAQKLGLTVLNDLEGDVQKSDVALNLGNTAWVATVVDGPAGGNANTLQYTATLSNNLAIPGQENAAPAAEVQLQQLVKQQVEAQLQAAITSDVVVESGPYFEE